MTRNFFIKWPLSIMLILGSIATSPAFAGGEGMFTITPNFTLADIQNETSPESANLDIGCGLLGKINFCYNVTKKITVTDIKISENKLRFNFGIMGSCKNFDTNHITSIPKVSIEGFSVKTRREEVRNSIAMNGQEYCVQSTASAQVDIPTLLQGQAVKRDSADRSEKILALKLDESSANDWAPSIQLVVTDLFRKSPKTVTKDLDYNTNFSNIAHIFGNPKETLSDEFNQRATPTEQAAADVANLLKEALKREFTMVIPPEDTAKLTFEDNEPKKVILQKSNHQMNIRWY